MRVIGGNAKGRRLLVPKGPSVRPTAVRVKNSLFNILPGDLAGMTVLDLFAGTGNLTIEALSRGAAEALLVEISPRSAEASEKICAASDTTANASRCGSRRWRGR